MKGIVFRMLFDLIEEQFGYEMVDDVIQNSNLESKGIYTSVGTYPFAEMIAISEELSQQTKIAVPQLHQIFGKYAFGVFARKYENLIAGYDNPYDFLHHVEDIIHVEVLKLYPEAELPQFQSKKISDTEMDLIYLSSRKMADFAEGLLEGCFEHFETPVTVETELLKSDKSNVRFIIRGK